MPTSGRSSTVPPEPRGHSSWSTRDDRSDRDHRSASWLSCWHAGPVAGPQPRRRPVPPPPPFGPCPSPGCPRNSPSVTPRNCVQPRPGPTTAAKTSPQERGGASKTLSCVVTPDGRVSALETGNCAIDASLETATALATVTIGAARFVTLTGVVRERFESGEPPIPGAVIAVKSGLRGRAPDRGRRPRPLRARPDAKGPGHGRIRRRWLSSPWR